MVGRAAGYVVILLLALVAASCGTSEEPDVTGTSAGAVTSSTSTTSVPPSAPPPGTGYIATTVAQGLRIPWEMRFLPDGRLLLTEREGRVVVVGIGSGEVTEVGRLPVLARGEGGLMGLALDPDFAQNLYVYLSYTHDGGGEARNRVSRLTLRNLDTRAPLLADETVLVDNIPAGSIHNGSRLAFGPDGYLWVTTGDAGDGPLAQRMDSLAGKVLRLTSAGQPAPGNPFLDRPYPFSLIYTLGHRNPQGLAFHPESGAAYVTEHGPSANDEVNMLVAGGNYGWPDLGGKVGRPGFVDPLVTWSPTIAPSGALFYSGDLFANLKGSLVFVTLKESDLRVLHPADDAGLAGVAGQETLFDEAFGRLRAIAEGPDGALYVATSNHDGRGTPRTGDDRIVRLEPGGEPR